MGGREVRKGKDHGQIFDHHYVEFQYQNGVTLNSQCRHQPETMSKVDELLVGTKGKMFGSDARLTDLKGNIIYQFDKSKENQPYQNEHDELFEAIAKGEYKFWGCRTRSKKFNDFYSRKACYLFRSGSGMG